MALTNEPNSTQLPVATAIPVQQESTIANVYPENEPSGYTPQSMFINQQMNGTPKMIYVWRLSKSIKVFSMIDIFFCFLYATYLWPFIFVILLPICGYDGAKKYDTLKLNIYGAYILLIAIIRIIVAVKNPEDSYGIALTILSVFVQLFIYNILRKLIKEIKTLTSTELLEMRTIDWRPVQTEIIWI